MQKTRGTGLVFSLHLLGRRIRVLCCPANCHQLSSSPQRACAAPWAGPGVSLVLCSGPQRLTARCQPGLRFWSQAGSPSKFIGYGQNSASHKGGTSSDPPPSPATGPPSFLTWQSASPGPTEACPCCSQALPPPPPVTSRSSFKGLIGLVYQAHQGPLLLGSSRLRKFGPHRAMSLITVS